MKYIYESRIRFSETDSSGALSFPGLINYFQDCATFQSESLGMGYDYLAERGQAWILSSWQIETRRMPRLYEKVSTATWAYAFKAFYGLRNFTLTDSKGEVCAWANSTWVLYDVAQGRPARVPAEEAERYQAEERWEMDYASRKILLQEGEVLAADRFRVQKYHLDRNHHVNNAQYIAMALAHLPDSFRFTKLRAEYRDQARLGDEISLRVLRGEEKKTFISLEKSTGSPYVLIELE